MLRKCTKVKTLSNFMTNILQVETEIIFNDHNSTTILASTNVSCKQWDFILNPCKYIHSMQLALASFLSKPIS